MNKLEETGQKETKILSSIIKHEIVESEKEMKKVSKVICQS